MLVLLLISRIVLEYIKAISKPTKSMHFNGMCKNDNIIFQFLAVQIIEQVCSNATNIEEMLWHKEKYWQSQLFTTTQGMNSLKDLYSSKRKGYRK